ncbi:MAG TPA: ABC transporter permease [Puia sp.]|nr:ABC transporter permease [Puia sp.]
MLKNYFKIAWRNITRHKVYSIINVLGLALGICACLVIYLITSYDFSFDRFHPDGDRIYRIIGEVSREDGEKRFLNSPFSDVAGFQHRIPGFEAASGFHLFGTNVKIPDGNKPAKKFSEDDQNADGAGCILTGPQYFDIFKYQWLAGDAAALNEPFKAVISEKEARKFFGQGQLSEMIGRKIIYADSIEVSVSGIVKDWDKNTDLGFRDFISISTATHSFLKNQIATEDWSSLQPHRSQAFVKLSKGVTAAQVNARFAQFIKKNVKLNNPGSTLSMWLQPLSAMHFTSDFHRGDDGDNRFRKAYLPILYALMSVALFILLLAAFNFINLSTAQSIQRAKEMGIRKVLGSNKTSLIFQFLTETLLLVLIAATISLVAVKPVLSLFSSFIPQGVSFVLNASTLIFLLVVILLTTFLSGIYPAKLLSGNSPVDSLKTGAGPKGSQGWYLRKGLIVFQFTVSLIFIIGTLVIGNQIRYMHDSYKGFSTDAILTLPRNWNDHSNKELAFKESIQRIPGVDRVILESFAPMGFPHMSSNIEYKGKDDVKLEASLQPANEGFVPFYEMKLLAGRNMFPSDSLKEILINETCAKNLGFATPVEAIGKSIVWWDGKNYPIVGVVADFFENSFHEPMKPVMIAHMPEFEKGIAIKLATKGKQAGFTKSTIDLIQKQWKKIYGSDPFNYHFLDESITWLYDQETNTAWLMNVAMLITIFISCMGIFGLAMFTAERRTKEIGIRKVLGATVANITTMLSRDFVVLVIIALVFASPIAWYLMNRWLQDFAYRVNVSWWVFVVAGSGAVIIAMITVSFKAISAATANPVTSLRSE